MGVLSKVISFGIGVYAGIYYSQNYDTCPKVEDPATYWKKFQDFVDEQSKKK